MYVYTSMDEHGWARLIVLNVVLTPVAASNVDILHRRSAEAFVATRCVS